MKKRDYLSWAITFVYFGIVSLLHSTRILTAPYKDYVLNVRNIPLVVGLIFLFSNKNRQYGVLLLAIAAFMHWQVIEHITNPLSPYFWVVIFFALAVVFYFFLRKK